MPMLDIFNDEAFNVVSLTDAVNQIKFVPGLLGKMGIFLESSVSTTTVAIEEKAGVLALINPTPRGGPGATLDKPLRTGRPFAVPHFEINDAVMADEVQNVRAWGSETELETVQNKVTERLGYHSQSMEATIEHARVGAVKGIVTYADGSTLNLFTEFGVTQEAEIDFDLDNAAPTSGIVRKKCAQVTRLMAVNLGGVPFAGVHAIVGDAFFDDLIAHPEVRDTYLASQQASELRSGYVAGGISFGGFVYGGVFWENYRGSTGGTPFVNTDKAHFFPLGAPGLFRTYFAPADLEEAVNSPGQRLYAKQYEMLNGKGRHLDTQSNVLSLCTRPKTLIQGKRT